MIAISFYWVLPSFIRFEKGYFRFFWGCSFITICTGFYLVLLGSNSAISFFTGVLPSFTGFLISFTQLGDTYDYFHEFMWFL